LVKGVIKARHGRAKNSARRIAWLFIWFGRSGFKPSQSRPSAGTTGVKNLRWEWLKTGADMRYK